MVEVVREDSVDNILDWTSELLLLNLVTLKLNCTSLLYDRA